MSIEFGLALDFWSTRKPFSQHLDDCVQLLKLAADCGFSSVWAGENRPVRPQAGHTPAPLLVLASLAGRTTLRLGTGVTLLTLWHPLQLAYEAALLDQMSDGRLVLGVGVGSPRVMKRFGIPPGEAAGRMDDSLRLLKSLWSGADCYRGSHFHVEGGVVPGPVQPGGPPLLLGGTVGRSAERAAELADGWYGATQYHYALIQKQARRYREALETRGRDPGQAVVAVNRTTFLAPTDAAARREGWPFVTEVLRFYAAFGAITDAEGNSLDPASDLFGTVGDDVYFAGSPGRCTESLARYVEAGVNRFNLRVGMADMPLELVERTIRLLGQKVLPRFL